MPHITVQRYALVGALVLAVVVLLTAFGVSLAHVIHEAAASWSIARL
jgi:hypothetical protein